MDYKAEVTWDNEEDEPADLGKGVKLVKVAWTSTSISNQTRRQLWDKYGAPNTITTAWVPFDGQSHQRQAVSSDKVAGQATGKTTGFIPGCSGASHLPETATKGKLTQKGAIDCSEVTWQRLGTGKQDKN